ncbi:MAG TPA: divalent-cation tolerance protein CutA [Nitrosomonas sp.]|nr:divalent-cation tolerance protein CutA [Nitrosomonas sp.]
METVLIISNFPNKKSAMLCAEALIDQRLAACVNVLSPCASVYHWQGKIESTDEVPILIKTQRQHYDLVEQLIKMMHPYELPEVILVPIQTGLPAYLQWVTDETTITD